MARYPGATWLPLPENASAAAITPTQLIFHSAVSRGQSLHAYFSRASVVVESHFYVQDDGDTEQYIDTGKRADANYKANPRALSVETWDDGNPDRVTWTPLQRDRLVDIAVWAHRTHRIPLVVCPSATAPGVGYHTLFRDWSPVVKTCPGIARRPQVAEIIARARAVLAGAGAPVQPGAAYTVRSGDTLLAIAGRLGTTLQELYAANSAVIGPDPARIRPGMVLRAPVGPVTPVQVVPATVPAPGRYLPPLRPFPLPRGHFFGPVEGPSTSVSGRHDRTFASRAQQRTWLREWGTRVGERGWPVGPGKRYLPSGNDGIYGQEYEELVTAFQRDQRITADGLCGIGTWNAASRNPIT